jgi:hypothetical protein
MPQLLSCEGFLLPKNHTKSDWSMEVKFSAFLTSSLDELSERSGRLQISVQEFISTIGFSLVSSTNSQNVSTSTCTYYVLFPMVSILSDWLISDVSFLCCHPSFLNLNTKYCS